jgi:hypothetical protein
MTMPEKDLNANFVSILELKKELNLRFSSRALLKGTVKTDVPIIFAT